MVSRLAEVSFGAQADCALYYCRRTTALAAPLWLTKLGLLIDNPWSNALDRSWSAGLILADVLAKRAMGVRPVTLVGFSLGARSIFYALTELAKNKKFGVVQDVFLIGAPVTASDAQWKEARSVVSGRFVNGASQWVPLQADHV